MINLSPHLRRIGLELLAIADVLDHPRKPKPGRKEYLKLKARERRARERAEKAKQP